MKVRTCGKEGFTLVELLIVVAIMSIISAMAVPAYSKYVSRSEAIAELATVKNALKAMALDTDLWPGGHAPFLSPKNQTPSADGSEYTDLTAADMGLFNDDGTVFSGPGWDGPYLPSSYLDSGTGKFLDPWGNPYFIDYDYQINGEWYVVVGSFGPNGTGINNYDSDDIYVIVGR